MKLKNVIFKRGISRNIPEFRTGLPDKCISSDDKLIRTYYKPCSETEKHGFNFVTVLLTGFTDGSDGWNPEDNVEVVCHGWYAFDGARHVYWGRKGYFHAYVNSKQIIETGNHLAFLEKTYCTEIL